MTVRLPPAHEEMLAKIRTVTASNPNFLGLFAAGSLLHSGFDEYSDLDLILVADPDHYETLMHQRLAFAGSLGELAQVVSGEHVGEPRLLICLYVEPLLRVDLKLVKPSDLDATIERLAPIWTRSAEMAERVANAQVEWPRHDPDWFEARFWIWIYRIATRIQRGELYEAMSVIDHIRTHVLGPLIHEREGRPQHGARLLEAKSPTWSRRLSATASKHEAKSILQSLRATVAIYRELRGAHVQPSLAEKHVAAYIDAM